MKILTGIQSSGKPHIGNYFGAIKPILDLSCDHHTNLFIADIHSLTSIKNNQVRRENTYAILAAILALGFDYNKNCLYLQSHIPQVTELQFYLSCFAPFPMLANAHSFKDRESNLDSVNVGLFTYPILMAADILLYSADLVPVGKDQKQHLEITRDLAKKFNKEYGDVFKVPKALITKSFVIPGIDGRKMSKSYNNYLDPFMEENQLRKKVNSIVTNSVGINDPKDLNCNVLNLYRLFSTDEEIQDMENKYREGISYSYVKNQLFEKILDYFSAARSNYSSIINDIPYMDNVLQIGKEKASIEANAKLEQIKSLLF